MDLTPRKLTELLTGLSSIFQQSISMAQDKPAKTTLVKTILGPSLHAQFRTFDDYHKRNAAAINPEIYLKKATPHSR